jgi:hypothetical protein
MICDICKNKFEYDEGDVKDSETFICYECVREQKKAKLLKLVKERIESNLDFDYYHWDDMIEDGDATEVEIIEALARLEVKIK